MTNDDKAASESGATATGDGPASPSTPPDADATGGQLFLPLDDFLTRDRPPRIGRQERVFCNRNLRLGHIAWVGFDMDYTLAIYNQAEMDRLSIEATITKLIARGYPEFIQSVQVPTDFAVRGLLIDKRFGHVLKMDRYKNVSKGFHGFRELSRDEIRALYHSKKIRPATPRYHWIDTLYALSEAVTYASLVQALEDRGFAVDYAKLFTDIRECIDEAHRDGTILDAIAADLPRFVLRDAKLAPTLHKLRSAGKRLFLLTNSRWAYTERMMTYLLGGSMSEYPSWRNFFDVVIVAATKPAFFQERRPLLEHEGGRTKPASLPLERGKVYEGGNLQELERAMGVAGDQVLYVGDHIYGDILRSKKDSAWRTAMIIQELETEVSAHESCRDDLETLSRLEELRERHEDDLRFYQARIKDLARQLDRDPSDRLEAERVRVKRAVERIRGVLRHVESESLVIERRADARFHPYWGSLMKDGNEQSSFGKQVDEYACIYTSRVSNLASYSPTQFFRSPRDVMAHEIGE